MLEIVAWSVEHLSERSSVFREADLCMLSLARSPGVYSRAEYVAAREQLKRDGHLVGADRRGFGPCLVTTQALRAERDIVGMMKRSRGKGQPIADPDRVGAYQSITLNSGFSSPFQFFRSHSSLAWMAMTA